MSRPGGRSAVKRWGAVAVGAVALVLLPVAAASAHPLGNFSVNRYDGLVVAPGMVRVDHVEDLAEIPTVQLKGAIDADGDGTMAAGELDRWAVGACQRAAGKMQVAAGAGSPELISAGASSASLRPGQAGLPTLRLECSLTAALPAGAATVRFTERTGIEGPGWREITARGDRMTLTASDVPTRSRSQRLSLYPKDMLSSPLAQDSATLEVRPGGPALTADASTPAASVLPRGVDRLTRWLSGLVAHRALTPGFAAAAIGAALALGALHALAPGHGKTIMAAAAAGSERRSLRDVLALGTSVAVTHTAGVAVLGTLIAGGATLAPTIFAWLTVASGALVVGAGATLLVQTLVRTCQHRGHDHHGNGNGNGNGHGHGHGHSHGHGHGHGHGQELGHAHGHEPDFDHGHRDSRARAHEHAHPHAHGHGRRHVHGQELGHAHGPEPDLGHAPDLAHGDRDSHTRAHEHAHPHLHAHAHSHPHDPLRKSRRGPILLGFAGGLVPSPSAVLILVAATVLGRLWFGVLLVAAYGVGLAACLAAVGLLVVHAGDRIRRHAVRHRALTRLSAVVPAGTATGVIVLGVLLAARGLVAI